MNHVWHGESMAIGGIRTVLNYSHVLFGPHVQKL